VKIIVSEDSFLINPLNESRIPSAFHSYKDHRMVMSLSPLALIYDKVEIDDYLPVKKSYPNFWDDLGKAGFIFELPEGGMKL
jgi:5-enolpyruvylshikimate-3-phosphate synthase